MTVTDRIRGAAVPAARTEMDARLQELMALPSLAAQLLLHAAEQLTTSCPGEDLTITGWGRTLARADQRILSGYPQAVAQHAARRAMSALSAELWASARTRGEWAICLRFAAKTV
ncbi:hypothetical protein ACIRJR_09470 [Streptomyces sp. NPDC102402]|uniref:hypothetical protein n=1 Tax=Streptomyces sp. NPDC102402 TaxID=3366169 RepID=UPI00382385C3